MAIDDMIYQSIIGRAQGEPTSGMNRRRLQDEIGGRRGRISTFDDLRATVETDSGDPAVQAAREALRRAVQEKQQAQRGRKIQRGLSAIGAMIDPNRSYADVAELEDRRDAQLDAPIRAASDSLRGALDSQRERFVQDREFDLERSRERREEGRYRSEMGREAAEAARSAREFERTEVDAREKADPNSPASQFVRTVLRDQMSDIVQDLEETTNRRFDEISIADLERAGIPVESIVEQYTEQRTKTAEPTALDEALEQRRIDRYIAAQDAALSAPGQIQTAERMIELLDDVATGPIAGGPLNPLLQLLEGDARSRFEQLSSQLQLDAADQLSGVLSDSDMRLLRGSVANLQSEEDANVEALRNTIYLQKKAQANARWMRDYYERTGELPDPNDVPDDLVPRPPTVGQVDPREQELQELEAELQRRRRGARGGQMGRINRGR